MKLCHSLRSLPVFLLTFGSLMTSMPVVADENGKAVEPNAACSIHLGWPAPAAEWFYLEGRVETSTAGSYFMVCGWNTGYFGVQELGKGRKVGIFSVWDPTKGDNPEAVKLEDRVEILAQGKDVKVSRFGGEGTGGKSMTDFPWEIGETLRCVVQARVEGEKTAYTGWLWQPKEKAWKLMATFRVHTGGKPLSGLYSFVEDFRRDGKSVHEVRRAVFGNGWVRTVEGQTQPLTKARFTHSKAPTEAGELIDAGHAPGGLYLQNGGDTKKSVSPGTVLEMKDAPKTPPADLPVELNQ
ncbi:uncharacterized protein DUF5077 [Roseimicrobium gellanilyticum]|uniref:Uncharacterized protein DUF5077 n=1 Tax=Roseimicrobium gellanilyticum TaxID=748857 RepID=A0A366HB18_9BACT|nr:DUF3472 domain-containing protein [Roseimicrobium gellanilyticum]RBP39099.1 uncharacterized protein DUF5077 [Roseimicrobium gellanilyticum]